MSWYNSPDGNAPRHSELMECHDCSNKVTCSDERPEFEHLYLCDQCADKREEARVREETENQIIDEEETPLGI